MLNKHADFDGDWSDSGHAIEYALSSDKEFLAHLNLEVFTDLLNAMQSSEPVSEARRSLWG